MAIKIPRDTIPAVQLPSTSSLGVASNNPISASMNKITNLLDTLATRKAENDRRIEAQRILNKNATSKSLLEKSKNEFLQKIEDSQDILTKSGYDIFLLSNNSTKFIFHAVVPSSIHLCNRVNACFE